MIHGPSSFGFSQPLRINLKSNHIVGSHRQRILIANNPIIVGGSYLARVDYSDPPAKTAARLVSKITRTGQNVFLAFSLVGASGCVNDGVADLAVCGGMTTLRPEPAPADLQDGIHSGLYLGWSWYPRWRMDVSPKSLHTAIQSPATWLMENSGEIYSYCVQQESILYNHEPMLLLRALDLLARIFQPFAPPHKALPSPTLAWAFPFKPGRLKDIPRMVQTFEVLTTPLPKQTVSSFDEDDNDFDFAERYLSDVSMINQLTNVNQRDAIEAVMAMWSDERLYTVGLASPEHWTLVVDHYSRRTKQPTFGYKILRYHPDSPDLRSRKSWEILPPELKDRIFDYFDVRDITAMAASHSYFRMYFAGIMRTFLHSTFEEWGLNWMAVKVMLHHTDALISGPAGNALLHPIRPVHHLRVIDFYASSFTLSGMLGYFKVATGYVPTGRLTLWRSKSTSPTAKISVLVSSELLTGFFPYVSAQGFRIHYPDFTLNGLTLANHGYISFERGAPDVQEIKKLDRLARRCGLQMRKYHFGEGACGTKESCPSVVRSTWKDSIFLVLFYERLWGAEEQSHREKHAVSWCLGPMRCDKKMGAVDFVHIARIEPRDMQQGIQLILPTRQTD
ncbi:hypothetical protein FB451DRAFT_1182463 [Mycena latifolia]|nr:hypothetical protein FB451DRAFT_1182463 [Mycena latifolia]